MTEIGKVPDVGAPGPEQRNSPIFDSSDSDDLSLDLELEEGVCFFNNQSYPIGNYVCSGDELLHCEERGKDPVTSNKFPSRGVKHESSITNYLA